MYAPGPLNWTSTSPISPDISAATCGFARARWPSSHQPSLLDASLGAPQIIGTGVAEAFFTRMWVSFIAAVFVALPVILYQIWRFVLPGLHDREIRYGRGFVFAGTFFFLCGAAFCYAIAFDAAFPFFLAEYERIGVRPTIRINEYLSFTSRMLLAFGIIFELPVATFFLARVGLVSHVTLVRYARHAIVIVFIVAAVLTPPDVVSQMLMAMPLLVLYGLSIGVAYAFHRPRMAPEESDAEPGSAVATRD